MIPNIDSDRITYSKKNALLSALDLNNCYNTCKPDQTTLTIKLKGNNKKQKWFKGSNNRGIR